MSKLTDIQEQIHEALDQVELLTRVKAHLAEVELKLTEAYAKIRVYDRQLDKELKDINELESIGVRSLFYKTLGSKEEQLEKERQEYLELSLHYKEYKAEVELMEYERDLLKKKEVSFPEVKQKLKALKELRQKEILTGNNERLREEMRLLLDKMDINVVLRKEISEAIQAGEAASGMITALARELQAAGDWGQWHIYGDRAAKYSKKQSIDRAMRILPKTRHAISIFMRELRDLGENQVQVQLNPIQFDKFTDFFFDNLISDWIVQQRIVSTLNNIIGTNTSITRILLSLRQELANVEEGLKKLVNEREKLILE